MKQQLFFMIVGALVFILNVPSNTTAQITDTDAIRIGAIFDIAEPDIQQGRAFVEGVLGHVNWLNANGGMDGRTVELLAQDANTSATTVQAIYDEFATQQMVGLIGWRSDVTDVLRSQLLNDQLPQIVFQDTLATAPDIIPYHYVVMPSIEVQLRSLLSNLLGQWVADGNSAVTMRVALFHRDSPYGVRPITAGQQFAIDNRIDFQAIAMPNDASDYILELQRADDFAVNHIIVHSDSTSATLLAQNTADFFGNPDFYQLACTAWCSTDSLLDAVADDVEAIQGVTTIAPVPSDLLEEIQAYLGNRPVNQHYLEGWLTAGILLEAIQRTLDANLDLTGDNIDAILQQFNESPFMADGWIAPVTFSPENHTAFAEIPISAAVDGQWQPVNTND